MSSPARARKRRDTRILAFGGSNYSGKFGLSSQEAVGSLRSPPFGQLLYTHNFYLYLFGPFIVIDQVVMSRNVNVKTSPSVLECSPAILFIHLLTERKSPFQKRKRRYMIYIIMIFKKQN